MKTAIQKAIEGGWKDNRTVLKVAFSKLQVDAIALLDPLFWQALGRSLGWGDKNTSMWDIKGTIFEIEMPEWEHHWHRFIDHLAEGKDAESFFNELLK